MRKWIKYIIIGLACFILMINSCNNEAIDNDYIQITGKVISKTTGLPIEGIKVSVKNLVYEAYTNKNGLFLISFEKGNTINLLVQDISTAKTYIDKDTLILDPTYGQFINIELDNK